MEMPDPQGPESSRENHALPLTQKAPKRSPSIRGFSLRPTPHIGLIIDQKYRVEGFLGEGGTATVYLARDAETNKLVVIKRMKPEVASNEELRQRFLMEAEALACVNHPAVIRVQEIREPEDEPPFLALEALRGESLGEYLTRQGAMPMEEVVRLMRQAAHALSAVHAAGVVHRDIKPDNLFLIGEIGQPESIKVLDFGMARLSDEVYDESSTSILGTAQYMAPEQILVEPVDARTDGYALGVVLFRMLTGHLPFEALSKNDLLRHQLFSPVPPVSWLTEDLPAALELIVHKATRKSPDERFASMEELAAALDALVGIEDTPPSQQFRAITPSVGPDIYKPVSPRGIKVAELLAKEFGVYSRPHSPPPPPAGESRSDEGP